MTGCAYFCPGNVPVIISDVKATYDGSDLHKLTPALVLSGTDDTTIPKPVIYRKAFILSRRTAIAVSGRLEVIREFLTICRANISSFEEDERPMRLIGQLAEEISDGNYDDLMVIGASVPPHEPGKAPHPVNFLRPGEDWEDLPYLRNCVCIGSGSEQLMDELRFRNSEILAMPESQWSKGYKTIHSMCLGMNTNRIINEITKETSDESWGSFLEYIYYDSPQMRWRRSDDQLYLFYLFGKIDDGVVTSNGLDRVFLYSSEGLNPRIAAVSQKEDRVSLEEWLLIDVGVPEREIEEPRYEYWSKWSPKRIVITAFYRDYGNDLRRITGTMSDDQTARTVVSITETESRIDIQLDDWMSMMNQLAEMKGFFFQPMTELSDEQRAGVVWPFDGQSAPLG